MISISFAFPKVVMTAQACGFSQSHRIQFLCMLTGHLQRLILTIPALSSVHKKAVTGGGCVWVSCTEVGGTHSPAEVISRGDNLMNRLPDRVPKAVNKMCVPLICSILSLS